MWVFAAVVTIGLIGPFIGIAIARESAAHENRPLDSWGIIRGAAIAGAVCIVPLAFLVALGAYGDWIVLAIACIPGALYGALVGLVTAWIRQRRERARV